MNTVKIRSIIGIFLAIALGLSLAITNTNMNNAKKEAYLAYLNDTEAQYAARYGHPEVTDEIKTSFNTQVLPVFISGAGEIIEGLSNPVKALSTSEEGNLALNILREFNFIK